MRAFGIAAQSPEQQITGYQERNDTTDCFFLLLDLFLISHTYVLSQSKFIVVCGKVHPASKITCSTLAGLDICSYFHNL